MNIYCIGAPQTGKTTWAREWLKNIGADATNTAAYDRDNEWDAMKLNSHDELISLLMRTTYKNGIFEDATYLMYSRSKEMCELLSMARGHLHHNIIICSHSLQLFPTICLPFLDGIYYTEVFDKDENQRGILSKLTENYKYYSRADLRQPKIK